jgi:hypothetical protein
MERLNSMGGERVRDKAAVATPRNRLGAHDDRSSISRERNDALNGRFEFGSLHVVGVSAERIVFPRAVDRVLARMAQTAEAGFVLVRNSVNRKRSGHYVPIVLRVPPGLRDRSDIHQIVHAVGAKHRNELVERMRGVADGVDRCADKFRIVS